MPALRDLQLTVRDAILGGDGEAAAHHIAGDGLPPEARLEIYRHHVFTTLTAALEATYPVVCRLVDRRFFAYAADRHIRAHPPTGPCLFEYGATFPDFLAVFPPCRDLGYLPDVARLEWAMNLALHAEESTGVDPARLGELPVEDLPRLRMRLDPSVSLLASPWPIDQIWRVNQDGAACERTVDLGAGGIRLEVRRFAGAVTMRALDRATHAFRSTLAAGRTLDEAVVAAFAADPSFDLAMALHEMIADRTLVDFVVSGS